MNSTDDGFTIDYAGCEVDTTTRWITATYWRNSPQPIPSTSSQIPLRYSDATHLITSPSSSATPLYINAAVQAGRLQLGRVTAAPSPSLPSPTSSPRVRKSRLSRPLSLSRAPTAISKSWKGKKGGVSKRQDVDLWPWTDVVQEIHRETYCAVLAQAESTSLVSDTASATDSASSLVPDTASGWASDAASTWVSDGGSSFDNEFVSGRNRAASATASEEDTSAAVSTSPAPPHKRGPPVALLAGVASAAFVLGMGVVLGFVAWRIRRNRRRRAREDESLMRPGFTAGGGDADDRRTLEMRDAGYASREAATRGWMMTVEPLDGSLLGRTNSISSQSSRQTIAPTRASATPSLSGHENDDPFADPAQSHRGRHMSAWSTSSGGLTVPSQDGQQSTVSGSTAAPSFFPGDDQRFMKPRPTSSITTSDSSFSACNSPTTPVTETASSTSHGGLLLPPIGNRRPDASPNLSIAPSFVSRAATIDSKASSTKQRAEGRLATSSSRASLADQSASEREEISPVSASSAGRSFFGGTSTGTGTTAANASLISHHAFIADRSRAFGSTLVAPTIAKPPRLRTISATGSETSDLSTQSRKSNVSESVFWRKRP